MESNWLWVWTTWKSLVRKISIFIALFLPMPCIADGYAEIYGYTKNGLTIVIFEDGRATSDIAIWRDNVQIAFYRDEPCSMTRSASKAVLTCAGSGRSPMAGAKYLEKNIKGGCPNPEHTYSCISGCSKGSAAPRTLERFYWEC